MHRPLLTQTTSSRRTSEVTRLKKRHSLIAGRQSAALHLRAGQIGPGEVSRGQLALVEQRTTQLGAGEVSTRQICEVEVGTFRIDVLEDRPLEHRAVERRSGQLGAGEIDAAQIRLLEAGIGKVAVAALLARTAEQILDRTGKGHSRQQRDDDGKQRSHFIYPCPGGAYLAGVVSGV